MGEQLSVPFQLHPRVGQLRFVLALLRLILLDLGAVGVRINLRNRVALMNILPLGKAQFLQLTIHPHVHGHSIERLNGAEAVEIDGNIALNHLAGHDRHGKRPRAAGGGQQFPGGNRRMIFNRHQESQAEQKR